MNIEQSAVKNSFSTYVWSKVDSCFCGAVYVFLALKRLKRLTRLAKLSKLTILMKHIMVSNTTALQNTIKPRIHCICFEIMINSSNTESKQQLNYPSDRDFCVARGKK